MSRFSQDNEPDKSDSNKVVKFFDSIFFNMAYRNKILASWVAGKLGLQDSEKRQYIRKIILYYLLNQDDIKLVMKISKDFQDGNVNCSVEDILKRLKEIDERVKFRQKY